jgi:hypothetical protein
MADKELEDMLAFMVGKFISFSLGRMEEEEDKALRKEMGAWPEKYWNSFTQVIRVLITDFLKGRIDESHFYARMELALCNFQEDKKMESEISARNSLPQQNIRSGGSFNCLRDV